MNLEQAKAILKKKFAVNEIPIIIAGGQNTSHEEFVKRFWLILESTTEKHLIFAAKLKCITDAGVLFFIQPFGVNADDIRITAKKTNVPNRPCTVGAAYSSSYKLITFFPSICEKMDNDGLARVIFHEVEHAFKNISNRIRQGKIDPQQVVLANPYFPVSNDERQKFGKLIQQGDERILEFLKLLEREQQGEHFNEEDQQRLKKYKIAASKHFPRERTHYLSKNASITERLKSSKDNHQALIPIIGNRKAPFQVNHIEERATDIAVRGFHIKGDEKEFSDQTRIYALIYEILLRDGSFEDEEEKIAEQHAKTVGELSLELELEILKCFYPEVLTYDEQNTAAMLSILGGESMTQRERNNMLFQGLQQKNAKKIEEALKGGAGVNHYLPDGETPLIYVLKHCPEEIIKLVLESQPDVNMPNLGMVYPIFYALTKGYPDIVAKLLEAGAYIFMPCGKRAVGSPELQQIERINPFQTALHLYKDAKNETNKKLIKILLGYGGGFGFNFQGHPEVVELLDGEIILGGICNAKNIKPITLPQDFINRVSFKEYPHWIKIFEQALAFPFFQKIPACMQMLSSLLKFMEAKLAEPHVEQLLQGLNEKNKEKIVEALKTVDVNQYFSDGRTPLIVAIQESDEEMVTTIMGYKPDVNKRNSHGFFAPIFSAIKKQNLKIFKLLLEAGVILTQDCCPQQNQQLQIRLVPPLIYVADAYLLEKREIQANMLKLLFEYGAGIGLNIPKTFVDLLNNITGIDNIVVIGGSCYPSKHFNAIATAEEFEKYIDKKAYPHWQKVFGRILQNIDSVNVSPFQEIMRILTHIEQTLKNESSSSKPELFVGSSVTAKSFSSSSIKISSPVTPGEDAHRSLMRQVQEFYHGIKNKSDQFKPSEFNSVIQLLREKQYAEALDNVAKKTTSEFCELKEIILSFKDRLEIKVREQPKEDNTRSFTMEP